MTQEALKLALDWIDGNGKYEDGDKIAIVIKKALAQPEQEPVAWEDILGAIARGWTHDDNKHKTMDVQLAVAIAKEIQELDITKPPQRTWVGLTEEDEIDWEDGGNLKDLVKAIEAKLKEKNFD